MNNKTNLKNSENILKINTTANTTGKKSINKQKESAEKLELINRAKAEIKYSETLLQQKTELEKELNKLKKQLDTTKRKKETVRLIKQIKTIQNNIDIVQYKTELQIANTNGNADKLNSTYQFSNIETNNINNKQLLEKELNKQLLNKHSHSISFQSRNDLIFEYQHYIFTTIDKYYTNTQTPETIEDLKSLIVEILTAAVRTYDPNRNTKLTTHMHMHIIGKCNRYLEYNTTTVKISSSFYNLKLKVSKLKTLNPEITEQQILDKLKITREQYVEIMNVTNTTTIDSEYSDGHNINIPVSNTDIENEFEKEQIKSDLQFAMEQLTPVELELVNCVMDGKKNCLPPQLREKMKNILTELDRDRMNSAEERYTNGLVNRTLKNNGKNSSTSDKIKID